MICHGNEGKGNGPLANMLKDFWEQPIRPANLTLPAGVQGGVKLGHSSDHLFKTLMIGIGGGPMPAYQGQLSPAEIWDIVHYVQSLRVEAHISELVKAGMNSDEMEFARRRIWSTLIKSSDPDVIESEVVRVEPERVEMNPMNEAVRKTN